MPLAFGGAPGPTGLAGTELILVEESAPPRLGPLQFLIEVRDGVVVLRDEQSPYGTEVSGISIGGGNRGFADRVAGGATCAGGGG